MRRSGHLVRVRTLVIAMAAAIVLATGIIDIHNANADGPTTPPPAPTASPDNTVWG
ncbi:hypothetical protein GCM10023322_48240 [Rugosimonospora acidiphila]|uniref:Uncharacterized protein n=1 Tax=Rugosimonospora acidiphila TaxID=556531 RepID=A0ABP9S4F1_9ACTN